jgi:hypothetical protein
MAFLCLVVRLLGFNSILIARNGIENYLEEVTPRKYFHVDPGHGK